MIKKLILGVIKGGLVLALGQFPWGNSTVGGEFVRGVKFTFQSLVGSQFVELMSRYVTEISATLRGQKARAQVEKMPMPRLKAWVPPETISKEDSEAVQAILEREL